MAEMTQTRMTMREFMELPETNQIVELIHGEVIVNPPPTDPHQSNSMLMIAFLLKLLPANELRHAPTGVYLDDENWVEPDIFWVSSENTRCTLGEDGYWHGAPDLVIEIFSPSTVRRDKKDKFELYQKYGVREYWMVDPIGQYVEAWRREGDRFAFIGVFGPDETFTSPVLNGQTVDVSAFFTA